MLENETCSNTLGIPHKRKTWKRAIRIYFLFFLYLCFQMCRFWVHVLFNARLFHLRWRLKFAWHEGKFNTTANPWNDDFFRLKICFFNYRVREQSWKTFHLNAQHGIVLVLLTLHFDILCLTGWLLSQF